MIGESTIMAVVSAPPYEISEIGNIQKKHDHSIGSPDHMLLPLPPEEEDAPMHMSRMHRNEENNRRENGNEEICIERRVETNGMNNCAYAHDPENVEDITSDHIANRDIRFLAYCGENGGDKLRERGSDRDDRETDECLGNTKKRCDINRSIYRQLSSEKKKTKTNRYKPDGNRYSPLNKSILNLIFSPSHFGDIPEKNKKKC